MDKFPIPLLPPWGRWLGVIAVAGVIFYFSIVIIPPEPSEPGPFWDKKLHFAAYAGFALALAYATVPYRTMPYKRVTIVIGAAIAYGIGIELLQLGLVNRYFSSTDLIANTIGTLLVSIWFGVERWVRYIPVPEIYSKGS